MQERLLPLTPSAEQIKRASGNTLDVAQRIGVAALVSLVTVKVVLLATGAVLFPLWGPVWTAYNRNQSLRQRGRCRPPQVQYLGRTADVDLSMLSWHAWVAYSGHCGDCRPLQAGARAALGLSLGMCLASGCMSGAWASGMVRAALCACFQSVPEHKLGTGHMHLESAAAGIQPQQLLPAAVLGMHLRCKTCQYSST